MEAFLRALEALPADYFTGLYNRHRYGVTLERLAGGRQVKLYAEALGSNDRISFNLYLPTSGRVFLKPCEMPAEKVMTFVLGVEPDS